MAKKKSSSPPSGNEPLQPNKSEAAKNRTDSSFESNPTAQIPAEPADQPIAAIPESPASDPSGGATPAAVIPRGTRGDAFEQNPIAGKTAADLNPDLDDSTRVREALRSVIEEGESLKDAARDWQVAPSAIAEWRNRYQNLLQHGVDLDDAPRDAADTYIPESAKLIFQDNWEQLVRETAATPSDFRQSPRQIFLQTSRLTSWMFHDGQLDRGIFAGAASGLLALAILSSFLLSDRRPAEAIAPPDVAPRDDLTIESAAKVAQSFFEAPTWQDRLAFVREPDAVREMGEKYYQTHPDAPITDAVLSLAMPIGGVVNLSYDVPSHKRSYFLCLVTVRGHWVVDWESSSLYQEAHLERLRVDRSPSLTRIAVNIEKNPDQEYYNYAFSDSSKWVCYQLTYPGLNLNLFAYAARDSQNALDLDVMLGLVQKHPAVLEVRFPPDPTTDNQVEIVSVLRDKWVPDDF